jgi:hypothetical protein
MPHIMQDGAPAREKYTKAISEIEAEQQRIDAGTDEETAASRLLEDKKRFATDVILDWRLSEYDLAKLSVRFNALSHEDGVRLRSQNFSAQTIARRNDCLRSVPAQKDRYAQAQRVESCMIERAQRNDENRNLVMELGAIAGFGTFAGLTGGYALGRRSGRKSEQKKSEAKAAAPGL